MSKFKAPVTTLSAWKKRHHFCFLFNQQNLNGGGGGGDGLMFTKFSTIINCGTRNKRLKNKGGFWENFFVQNLIYLGQKPNLNAFLLHKYNAHSKYGASPFRRRYCRCCTLFAIFFNKWKIDLLSINQ